MKINFLISTKYFAQKKKKTKLKRKIILQAFREESHIAFKGNKVRSLNYFFANTTEVRNIE